KFRRRIRRVLGRRGFQDLIGRDAGGRAHETHREKRRGGDFHLRGEESLEAPFDQKRDGGGDGGLAGGRKDRDLRRGRGERGRQRRGKRSLLGQGGDQEGARHGNSAADQPIAQQLAGFVQSTGHRPRRAPHRSRGVFIGLAFQVTEDQGSAVLIGQSVEGLVENGPELRQNVLGLGRLGSSH